MKNDLFIPMYIDKVKLVDLNSIICGGYNEFSEITVSTDNNSNSEVKANMGFNLFRLNSGINAGVSEGEKQQITGNSKYIQTASSMLASIYSELETKKLFGDVTCFNIGEFVDIKLKCKSNSIVEFLKKMKLLIEFGNNAKKLEKGSSNKDSLNNEIKTIDTLIKMIDNNANVVEYVCELDEIIYVVYLNKEYLYHTQLERINEQQLNYFAQVVSISNDYNFFGDTMLSEFDSTLLSDFIKSLKELGKNDVFSNKINLITSANSKKVIVLDVIGISRKISN